MATDRQTVEMYKICAGENPSAGGCSYIAYSRIIGASLCQITGEECASAIDLANNLLGFTETDEMTSQIKCGAAVLGLTSAGIAETTGANNA